MKKKMAKKYWHRAYQRHNIKHQLSPYIASAHESSLAQWQYEKWRNVICASLKIMAKMLKRK